MLPLDHRTHPYRLPPGQACPIYGKFPCPYACANIVRNVCLKTLGSISGSDPTDDQGTRKPQVIDIHTLGHDRLCFGFAKLPKREEKVVVRPLVDQLYQVKSHPADPIFTPKSPGHFATTQNWGDCQVQVASTLKANDGGNNLRLSI